MTLSITAKCPQSGSFGVAAVTALPAVGKLVSYAFPHAGAAATQARVNPYLGIDGIALLRRGLSAQAALSRLLDEDPNAEARQLALIDHVGEAAAWTGAKCLPWAGHEERAGFSIQGNRLVGPQVLDNAVAAFEDSAGLALPDRLLAAIEAGVDAGGDTKGEHSGSVLVVHEEEYPVWDIRVDHHLDPVAELRRLHAIFAEQLVPEIRSMPTRANPSGLAGEESV